MESRPTIAEIDLSALRHNFQEVKKAVPAGCGILAVVKADAYGHGFMDIATELEKLGVTAYGVAFLAEGIQLRKSGIDRTILILGGIYPGQEKKCIGFSLSTAVFSLEQARLLNFVAGKMFRKAKIHVKIDTGMGRLGISHDDAPAFFRKLAGMKHIELEGIISHFASADELDDDGRSFTARQAEVFARVVEVVEPGASISYARRYVAPEKTLIASVPVGYADGYSRALTNRGEVLVRGKRARVAGTVCMDWIMLDVTHIEGVSAGDEVVLLGCDREGNCIRAEELAAWAGTIPYEIFCGISKRVPRIYLNG